MAALVTPVRVAVRRKHCAECGNPFIYRVERGCERSFCDDKACRANRHERQARERAKLVGPCASSGCAGKATRKRAGLCEVCFYRVRRTGTAEKRQLKSRYATSAGYVKLLDRGHPLADASGQVFGHRKALYGKLGPGPHPCFWCGRVLEWKRLVVDHLNEHKQDNRPENLVPACNNCNRARGQFLGFIKRMRPDRLGALVDAFSTVIHSRKTMNELNGR
jgi:hypothetical protein